MEYEKQTEFIDLPVDKPHQDDEETKKLKTMDQYTFWLENYKVLYLHNSYTKFFPQKNMTYIEKLNSISRFAIYFLFVLLIIGKTDSDNYKWLYIPILILLCTVFLHVTDKKEKNMNSEKLAEQKRILVEKPNITPEETYGNDKNFNKKCETCPTGNCRKPTKNNPFMNVLLTDYVDDANRPQACSLDEDDIAKDAYDGFYEDLYRDVNDVYESRNSQRTYYTMPNTTIPNDTISFAKWLYNVPETCKTDNGFCYELQNNDLRQASRSEFMEQ